MLFVLMDIRNLQYKLFKLLAIAFNEALCKWKYIFFNSVAQIILDIGNKHRSDCLVNMLSTSASEGDAANPYSLIDKKFNIGDGQAVTSIMRAKLAREWTKLSDLEKSSLRSVRARRGIKCSVCGMLGVFRENCPKGCVSPFSTPDNSDSSSDGDDAAKKKKRSQEAKMVTQVKIAMNNKNKKIVTHDHDSDDDSDDHNKQKGQQQQTTIAVEEQSDSAHPAPIGLGVLWGDLGVEDKYRTEVGLPERSSEVSNASNIENSKKKKKDSASTGAHHEEIEYLRLYKNREQKRLARSDAKAHSFDFFTVAEEGYSRNLSEMTLHQIMRRLMRLLQGQLEKNTLELESVRDTSLLHPPLKAAGEHFYPKELADITEYRDYYYQKQKKADAQRKNYQHKGSLRPVDAMDGIFRAGKGEDDLYETNPRAGACMHSKIGWKDLLATNDALASSDPAMIKQVAAVEKLFAQQGQWVKNQNRSMVQLNDRFEHLIFVLKDEMEREHQRESRILMAGVSTQHNSGGSGGKGDNNNNSSGVNMEVSGAASTTREIQNAIRQKTKVEDIRTWVDRAEAVDRIILTLQQYDLVSGLDEVDFLLFCLNKWKKQCQVMVGKQQQQQRRGHGHGHRRPPVGGGTRARTRTLSTERTGINSSSGSGSDGDDDDDDDDGSCSRRSSPAKPPGSPAPALAANASTAGSGVGRGKGGVRKKKKTLATKGGGMAVAVGGINPYEATLSCLPDQPRVNNKKNKGRASTLHLSTVQREEAEKAQQRLQPSAMSNLIMQAVAMAGLQADGRSNIDPFADHGDAEKDEAATVTTVTGGSQKKQQQHKQLKSATAAASSSAAQLLLPMINEEGSITSQDMTGVPGGVSGSSGVPHGHQQLHHHQQQATITTMRRQESATGRGSSGMQRSNSVNSVTSRSSNYSHSTATGSLCCDAMTGGGFGHSNGIGSSNGNSSSNRANRSPKKPKLNPREQDQVDRRIAKESFRRAGLEKFIRSGTNDDIAYKCPALIPIPQAFTKGGSDADLHSYVGNQMVQKFRKSMVLSELGYTPQKMLPLYVRNTLFETNGTSPGGDQTNETMSKDSRYTHGFGRPFNRFEPPPEYLPKADRVEVKVHVLDKKKEEERLKELEIKSALRHTQRAEKQALKKERDEARVSGLNMSLARLVFGDGRGPKGHKVINHYYD